MRENLRVLLVAVKTNVLALSLDKFDGTYKIIILRLDNGFHIQSFKSRYLELGYNRFLRFDAKLIRIVRRSRC